MTTSRSTSRTTQDPPSKSAGKSFGDETAQQQAQHRRIKCAHDPRLRPKSDPLFFSMGGQRLCELMKFLRYEFGPILPDDDYGRDVLREILNQLSLAGNDPAQLRKRGCDLLPEIDDDDSLDDMLKEIGTGRKRKAGPLGKTIGLTYQLRVALDIRTIDCCDVSPAQRRAITAQKRAMDKRWEREKAGAKPHARSERKVQPWVASGISERTYYTRKKHAAKMVQSDPVAAFRPDYDVIISVRPSTATQDHSARAEPVTITDHGVDPSEPRYPLHRVGDDREAYCAFGDALDTVRRLSVVVEAVTNLTACDGADVAILADALSNIARGVPINLRRSLPGQRAAPVCLSELTATSVAQVHANAPAGR